MVLKRRHLAKAVTYRLCATTVTILVVIAVTGDVKIGLIIGPIDLIIKLGLYYLHEKMWVKTKFGITTASCGGIVMPKDVRVEYVHNKEWGLGKIREVSYDTGNPLVSVEWPDGRRGAYWVEELEFLVVPV